MSNRLNEKVLAMKKECPVLTAKDMQEIEAMAVLGLKTEDIARIKGLNMEGLKEVAEDVIKRGRAKGRARIMEAAFKMAASGKVPAMTLSWLKTQCGWLEEVQPDDRVDSKVEVVFKRPPVFTREQWELASEEEIFEYLAYGTIPACLRASNS